MSTSYLQDFSYSTFFILNIYASILFHITWYRQKHISLFFSFLFFPFPFFSSCTEDANRTYWNLSPLQCQQQAKTKKTRSSGSPHTTLYRFILSSLTLILSLSLSFSNLIFFQFCIIFLPILTILFFILYFFDFCFICLSLSYLFYHFSVCTPTYYSIYLFI